MVGSWRNDRCKAVNWRPYFDAVFSVLAVAASFYPRPEDVKLESNVALRFVVDLVFAFTFVFFGVTYSAAGGPS